MIGLDNTFLGLLLGAQSQPPVDPRSGKPIERLPERIQDLIADWQRRKQKVIIPTPVLSEFLVLAGKDGTTYLDEIDIALHLLVKPFDQKAAIELAAMYIEERSSMSVNARKLDDKVDTKAKTKFDRQIVAIIKANAKPKEEITIYSDDNGVAAFAERHGIKVVRTWELPAPLMKSVRLPGIEEEANDEQEQEQQTTNSVTSEIRGSAESDVETEARTDGIGSEEIPAEIIEADNNKGADSKPKAAS